MAPRAGERAEAMHNAAPGAGRPYNALERVFVELNIRLVAAVSFTPRPAPAVIAAVRQALAQSPAGRLAAEDGSIVVRDCVPDPAPVPWATGLAQALAAELATLRPPEGPCHASVLVNGMGQAWGVCLNACHVLWDGPEMKAHVQQLLQALDVTCASDTASAAPDAGGLAAVPVDWGQAVAAVFPQRCIAALPLPMRGLELSEVPGLVLPATPRTPEGSPRGVSGGSLRWTVRAEVVQRVRGGLEGSGATLTGALVACLQRALAERYLRGWCGRPQCCVTASVLVDLRPFLRAPVAQALGRVTVGGIHQNEVDAPVSVLALARTVSAELRARIDRGEAHSESIGFSEGRFGRSATFEFSYHGAYGVPAPAEVLLAQRCDDYDGLSVIAHSDRDGAELKLFVLWGGSVAADGVRSVVKRAVQLLTRAADPVVDERDCTSWCSVD